MRPIYCKAVIELQPVTQLLLPPFRGWCYNLTAASDVARPREEGGREEGEEGCRLYLVTAVTSR